MNHVVCVMEWIFYGKKFPREAKITVGLWKMVGASMFTVTEQKFLGCDIHIPLITSFTFFIYIFNTLLIFQPLIFYICHSYFLTFEILEYFHYFVLHFYLKTLESKNTPPYMPFCNSYGSFT